MHSSSQPPSPAWAHVEAPEWRIIHTLGQSYTWEPREERLQALMRNKHLYAWLLNIYVLLQYSLVTSLVAEMVKHLSTMRETQVRYLGWEDPLEKEMATHSSTLALKIPWMEEPGRLQTMGSQRVGHN